MITVRGAVALVRRRGRHRGRNRVPRTGIWTIPDYPDRVSRRSRRSPGWADVECVGAVRDASLIAVLADGRIAELGDHAELIAVGGTYARLYGSQSRGYLEEVAG